MPIRHEILRVYETDPAVIIGFGSAVIDPSQIAECREEIAELLRLHPGKALVIDLSDVQYIPSIILGMLASLTRLGTDVHLYNVSSEIREVLKVTGMSSLFRVHEYLRQI